MRSLLMLLAVSVLAWPAGAAESIRVKNLKVLAVIYRGGPSDAKHMDEHEVLQARNGVEAGRLFYFRNSRGRLNVEPHFAVFDRLAPDNEGPTMEHIEAHLRENDVKPGEYDGVFVTGLGLGGNFGGFELLGGAGGCFGGHGQRGGLHWYPATNDDEVAWGTMWNFVHEFQHALDLVIAEGSGRPDFLHGHPYADHAEPFFRGCYPGGEHFDWIACTLREFEGYGELKGVTNGFLDCVDTDGDGLADDDPRLPMDEARFGSDPKKADTDGDGSNDLAEFAAGRYRGSDPRKPDTDGDGVRDGEDEYPVVAIAAKLPYVEDGELPADVPPLLSSVFARNDAGGELIVQGGWDEERLYLRFTCPRPIPAADPTLGKLKVFAKIDGSPESGFWEGGDTYLLALAPHSARLHGLGLSGEVAAEFDQATDADGRVISWLVALPAGLGQGVSKEINYGGRREADDVVDGLTLVAGRRIAFNFVYEFEDGTRACLTPLHTMYAVTLDKPADAPSRPILRAPARTSAAVPVVEVLGVRPDEMVEVRAGENVVGRRVGSGKVHLSGPAISVERIDAQDEWELEAVAGDVKSAPLRLVVDRDAAPPASRFTHSGLVAECEPRATCELWWGQGGVPIGQLVARQAGELGYVEFGFPAELLEGWLVTGFEGSHFEKSMFVESWERVDRNWRGGQPDPRLPGDAFSYRLESILNVATAADWTFELTSDDGARLWIDGRLAINHWGHHGMSARRTTVKLAAGAHDVRIDYYELDGWAGLRLQGGPAGEPLRLTLPVRKVPVEFEVPEYFVRQRDDLGNVSRFGGVR